MINCSYSGFERADDLFNLAKEKALLRQLHSLLLTSLSPETTALKKEYHWRNLQYAMRQEMEKHPELLQEIGKNFVNYHVNFGRKSLLISNTRIGKTLTNLAENDYIHVDDLIKKDESF